MSMVKTKPIVTYKARVMNFSIEVAGSIRKEILFCWVSMFSMMLDAV